MSKTMNHAEYPASLKAKSSDSLRFIIADCREALKGWPNHPNAGYYLDEISYCGMELVKRGEA